MTWINEDPDPQHCSRENNMLFKQWNLCIFMFFFLLLCFFTSLDSSAAFRNSIIIVFYVPNFCLFPYFLGVFFLPSTFNGTIEDIIASFHIPDTVIVEAMSDTRNIKQLETHNFTLPR